MGEANLKKVARPKKALFLSLLFILSVAIALFVVWQVQAEEITPKVSKSELIASNHSWIATKTAIPLTDDISFIPAEKDTDVNILANGNLVVDVTNQELLTELSKEDSMYEGMKEYRLVIAAANVAEYINNSKFKYPMVHAYAGFSDYQIESGTREIQTNKEEINLTRQKNQVTTKSIVPVAFSDEVAKNSVEALQMNISPESLALDDTFQTTAKTVKAYPKTLFYDFNVTRSSWLIFSETKQVDVSVPIGIEYIIK